MTEKTAGEIYAELTSVRKALEQLYRDHPLRAKEWGKPIGSRIQHPPEVLEEMKWLESEETRVRQVYKAALARSRQH